MHLINNFLAVALLLLLGLIILHGVLGDFIKSDGISYCSLRAVIHQVACSSKTASDMNSGYIKNLLLSNSENQRLFQAVFYLFLLPLFAFFGGCITLPACAELKLSFFVPATGHDGIVLLKLRRWSRRLIQSPV